MNKTPTVDGYHCSKKRFFLMVGIHFHRAWCSIGAGIITSITDITEISTLIINITDITEITNLSPNIIEITANTEISTLITNITDITESSNLLTAITDITEITPLSPNITNITAITDITEITPLSPNWCMYQRHKKRTWLHSFEGGISQSVINQAPTGGCVFGACTTNITDITDIIGLSTNIVWKRDSSLRFRSYVHGAWCSQGCMVYYCHYYYSIEVTLEYTVRYVQAGNYFRFSEKWYAR